MIVAELRPQPPIPSSIRKLPQLNAARRWRPRRAPLVEPTREAAGTVVSACAEAVEIAPPVCARPRSRRIQAAGARTLQSAVHSFPRHARPSARGTGPDAAWIPDGDVAAIFERALTLLLSELRKTRTPWSNDRASRRRAAARGRHVPAAVRRAVWERDKGQCAFVGAMGRCTERGFLEYHQRHPVCGRRRDASRTTSSCGAGRTMPSRTNGGVDPAGRTWCGSRALNSIEGRVTNCARTARRTRSRPSAPDGGRGGGRPSTF